MVGVPRSKACTTCRRRKVGCDQQKPFCQRCIKANKQCEGYEHYPVFVHRTQDGLVPRARFEEVKPSSSTQLQSLTHGSDEQNVMSWFANSHALHHGSWINYAIEVPSPSAGLHKAMLALSLTRYGRLHANDDAVLRGQQIYGEALGHLQKSLYDQERMWHDETLVCVRAAILYELFESTSDDPVAWQNHLSGISRLIELRGPNGHGTPMAKSVLEDVRYVLMLRALMLRRQSPLSKIEWQMGWLNAEQELYDLGFQLAGLLEQSDQQVHDVEACNKLHTAFEELKTRLEKPSASLTLFACELTLGFIAAPIGLEWASNCTDIADTILRLLPPVTDSGDEHRSIFPLTCILWHYRDDKVKYVQAESLMSFIVDARKVRFAGANYQVEPLIPNVAKND